MIPTKQTDCRNRSIGSLNLNRAKLTARKNRSHGRAFSKFLRCCGTRREHEITRCLNLRRRALTGCRFNWTTSRDELCWMRTPRQKLKWCGAVARHPRSVADALASTGQLLPQSWITSGGCSCVYGCI